MKKVLYTILSILSIIYIGFLIVNVVEGVSPGGQGSFQMGWFRKWFDIIVDFGGVAIIFAFALVNFAGSPLKTVFFILLILAIVCYIIVMITPNFFYDIFSKKENVEGAAVVINTLMRL